MASLSGIPHIGGLRSLSEPVALPRGAGEHHAEVASGLVHEGLVVWA